MHEDDNRPFGSRWRCCCRILEIHWVPIVDEGLAELCCMAALRVDWRDVAIL